MTEETHVESEQLFDTQDNEVATGNDDDTNEDKQTSDSEQHQNDTELNLDSVEDKAKENRINQINAWQNKIDSGKVTIDDIPANLNWIKKELKTTDESVDQKAMLKQVALEAIEEEKEKIKFSEIKNALNDTALTEAQRETIQKEFSTLTKKGLSKFEALKYATKFAGVKFDGNEEMRRNMSIPMPSTKIDGNTDIGSIPFGEVTKKLSEEKINEHLKGLVQ